MTSWRLLPAFNFGLSKTKDIAKDDLVVVPEGTPPDGATAIALVYCDDDSERKRARMIAAAPDLLEALLDAEEQIERFIDIDDGVDGPLPNWAMRLDQTIKAALKKAGQQQLDGSAT